MDEPLSARFIGFLKETKWGYAVENDFNLQSLAQRADGTRLLSAMAPPDEFITMMRDAGAGYEHVVAQAEQWIKEADCNEVMIHFVDARQVGK